MSEAVDLNVGPIAKHDVRLVETPSSVRTVWRRKAYEPRRSLARVPAGIRPATSRLSRRVSLTRSRVLQSLFIPAITLSIVLTCCFPGPARAEQPNPPAQPARTQEGASKAAGEESLWQYGAYLDVNYGLNFNFPENHQFRSRGTTPRTNKLAPNMALGYVRKLATAESRWAWNSEGKAGTTHKTLPMGKTVRTSVAAMRFGISPMPMCRIWRQAA